jgi:type VI secretion system secreted protein Hcp
MKSSLRPIGLVLSLLLAGAASAAETQYLFLKGQKSGIIKGGVTAKGQEGAIQVDSISHEIVSPRDASSGMATGRRQHKPLTLVVRVDKSWPLLYNVLVSNENLSQVELRVLAPSTNGSGTVSVQRKVLLTNANISDIQQYTVDGTNGSANYDVLKISLTYQKIEWDWIDGGISAVDDWETRN